MNTLPENNIPKPPTWEPCQPYKVGDKVHFVAEDVTVVVVEQSDIKPFEENQHE